MTASVIRVAAFVSLWSLCFAAEPSVTVEIDPTLGTKSMAMWLAYLLARQEYRIKHNLPTPASGEIVPSFAEEVSARNTAVQIYSELKEKDKQLHESYWETLSQIKAKGFMDAYLWTYLRRPEWTKEKEPANLHAFEIWKNANLKDHKPQTVGRLTAQTK